MGLNSSCTLLPGLGEGGYFTGSLLWSISRQQREWKQGGEGRWMALLCFSDAEYAQNLAQSATIKGVMVVVVMEGWQGEHSSMTKKCSAAEVFQSISSSSIVSNHHYWMTWHLTDTCQRGILKPVTSACFSGLHTMAGCSQGFLFHVNELPPNSFFSTTCIF